MKRYPTALTIAGSDSGGCAGIQADLKTFAAIGVFGTTVITAVTAQNTRQIRHIENISPNIVREQLEAVLDDIKIDAVKIGMLPSVEIVTVISDVISHYKLDKVVVDPVMAATSGERLSIVNASDVYRALLYDKITLITPNVYEAEILSGIRIRSAADMYKASEVILKHGCRAVLIKGGHLPSREPVDILFQRNSTPVEYAAQYVNTSNLHGTGCSLSSAITAFLALGCDLEEAVRKAKEYMTSAIAAGVGITTGHGDGPVNHFFDPKPLNIIKQ